MSTAASARVPVFDRSEYGRQMACLLGGLLVRGLGISVGGAAICILAAFALL